MGALRFFRRTGEGVYDMEDLARRTWAGDGPGFLRDTRGRRWRRLRVAGMGYSNGANILASVAMADPGIVDRLALLHPLIPFEPRASAGACRKAGAQFTAGRRRSDLPRRRLTERLAEWLTAQGAEGGAGLARRAGHEIRQEEVTAVAEFLAPPQNGAPRGDLKALSAIGGGAGARSPKWSIIRG